MHTLSLYIYPQHTHMTAERTGTLILHCTFRMHKLHTISGQPRHTLSYEKSKAAHYLKFRKANIAS